MDSGDHNLATLIADLEESDKPALRKAVDELVRMVADDAEIGTILSELLSDPCRKNRWPIAYILASLPSPPQSSIEVLIETLDHRDPDIRWAVALTLIRLAKADRRVLQLLIALASKGTVNQRRMAIYSLRNVGVDDAASVETLLSSLRDLDPTVRVAAVTSLKSQPGLGEIGKNELLRLFLNDQDLRVRNSSAVTLAQLGAPSEAFLNELIKAAASDNAQLKKAATAALDILKKRSAPSGS